MYGILKEIRKVLDMSAPNNNSNVYQLFDSFKNQVTGKLHEPHAHFIENGIHSITLTSTGKKHANFSSL